MFKSWFQLNRGVLLSSLLLGLLLLWLSVSFLVQAFSVRQDAQFISRYLDSNQVIRETVKAIAEERAASHWLTRLEGMFSAEVSLSVAHKHTDKTVESLVLELQHALSDSDFTRHLTYQPVHLETLTGVLGQTLASLDQRRADLIVDLDLPLARRNQSLHLSTFDFYSQLISQLEVLRHAFRYQSLRPSREINTGLLIADAAWNLNLSHYVLSALFDGYITNGYDDQGTMIYERSVNMQRSVDTHWSKIKDIYAFNSIDEQLHGQAIELNQWFGGEYFPQVKLMTRAIASRAKAPYSNWQWRKLARSLEQYTDDILVRADTVSRLRVDAALKRANRNLAIDIALVLICLGMMVCAFWVFRRMHHQANHDDLTRLPNRHQFQLQSERLLDGTSQQDNYVLLALNLHKFKSVNDSYGQLVGDALLQNVASAIKNSVASGAVVARMGGDEFHVLQRCCNRDAANAAVEQIKGALASAFIINGQALRMKACIGYALFPNDAGNSEDLRKAADLALHDAKQKGAGTIACYNPAIAKAFQERQQLEADLHRAIQREEFELHYQPQFDLLNSAVDGVEALLRWNHPKRGNVPPYLFIPVAEEGGMLPVIGQWVIEEAVRQSALWHREFGLHLRMSVNVSAHQFLHGDLVAIVKNALEREKLEPESFEIEITETVAMAEMDVVVAKLDALRALGVRIALDDFGTGYSSLGYLQDLPLDTLKIDRSFISKIDEGVGNQRVLIESIAHLAKLLKYHTVAEGVETDTQLQHVRSLGIDTVQGYYYSKPVSAEQVPGDVEQIDSKFSLHSRKAA